jgi:arylsulfatase A-like enzyme
MERRRHLLIFLFLLSSGCSEPLPNVILISLDTVRADHLSVHGYHRDTTPTLTRLAEEGIVFERAFTPTPWTVPAHMSVFTSLYPSVHSVSHLSRQSDMSPTLAEMLQQAGYLTAAFVAPVLSPDYGFSEGFEHYFRTRRARPADLMVDRALEWLAKDPAHPTLPDQPFFLFLHLFDAHHPYEPPWPFDTAFISAYRPNILQLSASHPYSQDKNLAPDELSEIVGLYDGEIAYADNAVDRFLGHLDDLGLYDSSLIVVFGDHGEGFLEHGLMNHGNSVYEELIRVPLLLRLPGGRRAGTRVGDVVQLTDITPTVLEEVGREPLPVMQGSSLLRLLDSKDSGRAAHASEAYAACLRTRSWKLIENPPSRFRTIPRALDVEYELYDLEEDPEEQNNLAFEMPEKIDSMVQALHRLDEGNRALRQRIREALQVRDLELTEEQERELRALGYIQ